MRPRNIKSKDQLLTPSEQKENNKHINLHAATLAATLCSDDTLKQTAAKELITLILTQIVQEERLYFNNVLENYAAFFRLTEYQSSLSDVFKQLIQDSPIDRITALVSLVNEGTSYKEILGEDNLQRISSGIRRIKQQDIEFDKRAARPTSIIGILEEKGFLAANEPYFDSDLQSALAGYRGRHGNVTVISDISITDSFDLGRLKPQIDSAKAAARKDDKAKEIYLVTNNGTYHFVCVKIKIHPEGHVEINLQDSKPSEKVSAEHKAKNDSIIKSITVLSETDSKAVVTYTGEQGNNANCPFYSVREVIRRCSALPEFKVGKADDLREAAASENIVDLQLAMTQKVARKKGLPEDTVASLEVDDLGILHTKVQTKDYQSHRKFRLQQMGEAEAKEREKQKIIAEVKAAEIAADIAEVKAAVISADDNLKAERDASITPQEKIIAKLVAAVEELKQATDRNPSLSNSERKQVNKISDKIITTLGLITENELSLEDHKNYLAQLKKDITELSQLNPEGLKLLGNILGIVTIFPALIARGVTGRWSIFSRNVDPSVGLGKLSEEIDKLEKTIPPQSLDRS